MCSIGGLLGAVRDGQEKLQEMAMAMAHRAPDGSGFFDGGQCLLLHGLLRIHAPSTLPGPYRSLDDRWVLSFNGEIYNHRELRLELEQERSIAWRHETDAEVLLEGWSRHGASFLARVNGMFAFALWDSRSRTLTLGRDRLGEKPLYYGVHAGCFFFASEIKALKAAGFPMRLERDALEEYLAYRYVSGPRTLFHGISKLPPAHLLTITAGLQLELRRYWRARPSSNASGEELAALVNDAHKIRMSSIWPPSVFLSGGIDSTAVASFLPGGAKAFTFRSEVSIDETLLAKEAASRFGLAHEAVGFEEGREQERRLLSRAVWALEEPIGDSIILPTVALAEAASRHTRVVFSGEGADEIFGGYVHHLVFQRVQQARKWLGQGGAKAVAALIERAPVGLLEKITPYPGSLGAEGRRRAALCLREGGVSALTNLFDLPSPVTGGRRERERGVGSLRALMDLDLETWLPDYTLVRLDKILMSFGLEGRLPFLDHRLVEHSLSLDTRAFIQGASRKVALRRALEARLGKAVSRRPKRPFVADLSKLDGRDPEAEASASCERLLNRGILRERPHLSGATKFLMAKRAFSLGVLDEWSRAFEVEA